MAGARSSASDHSNMNPVYRPKATAKPTVKATAKATAKPKVQTYKGIPVDPTKVKGFKMGGGTE